MRSRHRRLRYELLETRDLLTAVQISDEIVGHSNSRITVPVEIDDATGVRAAEIQIEYDTARLVVQPKDIAAGSAWAGKAIALANVDQPSGVITVFVFSTGSLAGGSGSLIDVSFTIRPDVRATNATVDLAEVRLNEGQITLMATPVAGADTTDGVITIKRDTTRQHDRSPRYLRGLVCVADVGAKSQDVFALPTSHDLSMHPLQSTLSDKRSWLRRGDKFVGPIADQLFATTDRWLLG
jgi:hypothetical protein